jgi:hypothetical protein
MTQVECEYCGKKVKTQDGLLRHQRYSTECIQSRKQQEFIAKGGQEATASGKDKFEIKKKFVPLGKRKVDLDEEDSKPPAKMPMVLDMVTMQRLTKIAGSDKGRLNDLMRKELQDLCQFVNDPGPKQKDNMGWLPYDRKFVRQDPAAMLDNNDAELEEEFAGFGDDVSVEGEEFDETAEG